MVYYKNFIIDDLSINYDNKNYGSLYIVFDKNNNCYSYKHDKLFATIAQAKRFISLLLKNKTNYNKWSVK